MIKLRPHHLLCSCFYTGKGYSKEFCSNFSKLLKRLDKGEAVMLTDGLDDLCAFCPSALKKKNLCAWQEKVSFYDAAIVSFFGLRYDIIYNYLKIINIVKDNLPFALDFCNGCEWQSLCREAAKKYE